MSGGASGGDLQSGQPDTGASPPTQTQIETSTHLQSTDNAVKDKRKRESVRRLWKWLKIIAPSLAVLGATATVLNYFGINIWNLGGLIDKPKVSAKPNVKIPLRGVGEYQDIQITVTGITQVKGSGDYELSATLKASDREVMGITGKKGAQYVYGNDYITIEEIMPDKAIFSFQSK